MRPRGEIAEGAMSEYEIAAKLRPEEDTVPVGGPSRHYIREWISWGFGRVEDVVYLGLGLLLAISALALLTSEAFSLWESLRQGTLAGDIVLLLDRILLILMIVEVLSTVLVSFREHALVAEPFLIVGLIAAIRRILILTAEFSRFLEMGELAFRNAMIELGLLTIMVVALVTSLFILRRQRSATSFTRT
jgi:uncharacterized membrane protein (DUF373 family)